MGIEQNPVLYIVRINHLQLHSLAEKLFVVLLARANGQDEFEPLCVHTLVLHSDFVFRACTDSWLHVVLLTDQTSNRLYRRQIQLSSSVYSYIAQVIWFYSYAQSQGKGQLAGPEYIQEKGNTILCTYIRTYACTAHIRSFFTAYSVIFGTKPFFLVDRSWIVLDWESSDTYAHTHTFQLSH